MWELFEAIVVMTKSESIEELDSYKPSKKKALSQDKLANLTIFALRKRK